MVVVSHLSLFFRGQISKAGVTRMSHACPCVDYLFPDSPNGFYRLFIKTNFSICDSRNLISNVNVTSVLRGHLFLHLFLKFLDLFLV